MLYLGQVKWFSSEKGYGFITPENGGNDVFAHQSQIRNAGLRALQENQRVRFNAKPGPQGVLAQDIEVL